MRAAAVAFYDSSEDETNHRVTFAVHKTPEPGQSYSTDDYNTAVDSGVGLSDPETGNTTVVSCAIAGRAGAAPSDVPG